MKAVRVHEFGNAEALTYEEVEKPEAGEGEARVKVEAIGLNFIDVYLRDGRYPRPLPFIPGHEAGGVVDAVGANVTEVKPGDRVAYAMVPGSYAEYAIVPAWKLVQVPTEVDIQQASAVILQGLTAHYLTHSTFALAKGHTALVHAAAGGVGMAPLTDTVMAAVPIGEQPVWDPRQWDRTLQGNARLRWQLRRVRARGVQVRQLVPGELAASEYSGATTQDLQTLIDGWLATRRMPPMGFLLRVEPHASFLQRRCFVAEWEGRLAGLVYVIPVPRRNGWFVEHMVRAPWAPNGTVELLVDAAMHWAAEQGCPWFTLGLAPLSGEVPRLLRIARKRLAFLYNFDGLRYFKAKLRPTKWQPIFLSYPAGQGALATLLDVLAAFARNGNQPLPSKEPSTG